MKLIAERNLRSVDLKQLVVFDALMAKRNVTRAAARNGLSQPAVSKVPLSISITQEAIAIAGAEPEPTHARHRSSGSCQRLLRSSRAISPIDITFAPRRTRTGVLRAEPLWKDRLVTLVGENTSTSASGGVRMRKFGTGERLFHDAARQRCDQVAKAGRRQSPAHVLASPHSRRPAANLAARSNPRHCRRSPWLADVFGAPDSKTTPAGMSATLYPKPQHTAFNVLPYACRWSRDLFC
jgi:hypothetical protein